MGHATAAATVAAAAATELTAAVAVSRAKYATLAGKKQLFTHFCCGSTWRRFSWCFVKSSKAWAAKLAHWQQFSFAKGQWFSLAWQNVINRRKLRCCFAFLFWPSETWKRVNILLPFSILSLHLSIYLEDCERHDMLKIPDKSNWNYFHFKHPKHPNNCDKR